MTEAGTVAVRGSVCVGACSSVVGETGTGNMIILVVAVVASTWVDVWSSAGCGVGSLDVLSVCKCDAAECVTDVNLFDFIDLTDASLKAGGPDTVVTRGPHSGVVVLKVLVSSDGATLRMVVSRVVCSRFNVPGHSAGIYVLSEFVS